MEVGRELFMKGHKFNGYAVDANKYPGIKMIARLLDVIEEAKDFWLVYEVGAQPLTKLLFEVKGETYKGERIYGVNHQEFYTKLKEDKEILRDFIFRLAQIFEVLTLFRIVHADIKPDNILIALDAATHKIADIKLIDFGSAFSYENPTTISASTPEYLAPEVLEYLENRG
jgi:serine/threonine protein kinase